jgi:hypothetical protein
MVVSTGTSPSVWQRALLRLTVSVFVLQSGCATTVVAPVLPQEVRDSLGVVAIVPAQYEPQSKFLISWRHKEGATGKQAALTGGAGTAATALAPAALGPVGVLAGVIWVGTATVVEAVRTSEGIVPVNTAEEIESSINKAVAKLDVQNALAGRLATMLRTEPRIRLATVVAAGPNKPDAHPDYAQLRTAGIDTVFEVAINEIGFDGCIMNNWECRHPHVLYLFMRAQLRLVRVSDGAVLFAKPLEYRSGNRELTKWLADSGRMLGEEFDQAYRELAERVYDEVLLVTPIELPFDDGMYEPRCWLEPLRPKAFGRVDTLRPTLRWTAFPREIDRRELDPAVLGKIGNVTYDLRIWDEAAELRNHSVTDRWRNRLFYERTSLVEPRHTLEIPLAPESRYYWSVRARFVVDGRSMVTRWARWSNCLSDKVLFGYYQFDTPK